MTCDLLALEKLLSWRLRGLGDHIDFEDLKQECRIAAWRAVTNHTGGCSRNRLILKAIDREACDFLRSPMNRNRTRTRWTARVPPVSLDRRGGPAEVDGWCYPEPEPRVPDFEGPLLARAYARWLWSVRRQVLSARQIQVLQAVVLDEQPVPVLAAVLERGHSTIYNEKVRALARYRQFLQAEPGDD